MRYSAQMLPRTTMLTMLLFLLVWVVAQDAFAAEPITIAQGTPEGWQTFESCPTGERPCGPVCMPESFSCCSKPTGTICPPGKTCCGASCGCGRCKKCEAGTCVPDPKCADQKEEAAKTSTTGATPGVGPLIVPGAVLGVGVLGAAIDSSDDQRIPVAPRPPSP